jgi:hypothetical protein
MSPDELSRARAILRNRVKSHPKDHIWADWQIRELTERLAAADLGDGTGGDGRGPSQAPGRRPAARLVLQTANMFSGASP